MTPQPVSAISDSSGELSAHPKTSFLLITFFFQTVTRQLEATFEPVPPSNLVVKVNVLEVVMNKRIGLKILLPVSTLFVLLLGLAGTGFASEPQRMAPSISDEIRHELLMLPYYNVFDELNFSIDGSNTVTLSGKVTRPILKSDAEAAVRNIQGINEVINNIEVLPLSPFDNTIRRDMLWAIYSKPGFEKYAIEANPPIKIIVENGNVTLDGVVDSQLDKQIAEMAARSVPGVFSVTDNLKVS